MRSDVTTAGGEGVTLVRGEQVRLQAIALSIKREGHIDRLTLGGQVRTSGDGVASLEVLGTIDSFELGGGIAAEGTGSDAAHVVAGRDQCLDGLQMMARSGRRLVHVDE